MINANDYPLLDARRNTPFVQDLLSSEMTVNGQPMPRGIWNLMITRRDLTMWVRFKMKPHRHWRISSVKKYFGLTGSGQKLLDQFNALKAEVERVLQEEDQDAM